MSAGTITVNGRALADVRIELRRSGDWFGVATFEDADSCSKSVEIVAHGTDGSDVARYTGTITAAAVVDGRLRVDFLGGPAKLDARLPARFYRGVQVDAGLVLRDIAREAGETLSGTISASLLAAHLGAWVRPAGSARRCFQAVADQLEVVWRRLPDGTIWFGTDTWERSLEISDERAGLVRLDPWSRLYKAFPPLLEIVPGMVVDGMRVSHVVHTPTMTSIYREVSQGEDPRIDVPMETQGTPVTLRMTAMYRWNGLRMARVVAARANAVDVVFQRPAVGAEAGGSGTAWEDDPAYPGVTDVPVRSFVPGVTAVLKPGAQAVIGWESGSPGRPAVVACVAGSELTDSVVLDAGSMKLGAAATRGVARLNDTVDIGTLTGIAPPGGGPVQFVFVPAGVTEEPDGATSVTLSGKVSSASSKAKSE